MKQGVCSGLEVSCKFWARTIVRKYEMENSHLLTETFSLDALESEMITEEETITPANK